VPLLRIRQMHPPVQVLTNADTVPVNAVVSGAEKSGKP
jgi:hypothetical protein